MKQHELLSLAETLTAAAQACRQLINAAPYFLSQGKLALTKSLLEGLADELHRQAGEPK